MTGRFISVVGPSGVGKDSVMEGLALLEPRVTLVRRVISRPSTAGGEIFDGVSTAEFEQMRLRGNFTLFWSAHGLNYAIPANVENLLADGHDVLANLSRGILKAAAQRFSRSDVIALTAPKGVLAARLLARGRETEEEISARLDRADFDLPDGVTAHHISNSGPLDEAVKAVHAALYPESEAR